MTAIREMMTGLIDYAGLFPPARLAMHPVVDDYARYVSGDNAWILGRLICPASRLAEMANCVASLPAPPADQQPWRVSMLGRASDGGEQFLDQLNEDILAARESEKRLGSAVIVDAYEVRVPDALCADGAGLGALAQKARNRLLGELGRDVRIFFEVPFSSGWNGQVPRIIAVLGQREGGDGEFGWGVKIRTGGVEAHMIPSIAQVACFIDACNQNNLAFKATAGLHHPIRHHSEELSDSMHGFINVFAAAVFAEHANLAADPLERVLDDRVAASFSWSEDGLSWKDLRVSARQIAATRASRAISYGSCSFDEPIDDLHSLGWL